MRQTGRPTSVSSSQNLDQPTSSLSSAAASSHVADSNTAAAGADQPQIPNNSLDTNPNENIDLNGPLDETLLADLDETVLAAIGIGTLDTSPNENIDPKMLADTQNGTFEK